VPITKLQYAIGDHKELSTALSESKKKLSEQDYTFIRLCGAYFKIISAWRRIKCCSSCPNDGDEKSVLNTTMKFLDSDVCVATQRQL
jgi:hypothetical protein